MAGAVIPFVPALHGFRAIAAMEVLLFHWVLVFPAFNTWLATFHVPGYPWINPTLPWAIGWQGVPLFFVLSGYLLTSQWQGRPLRADLIRNYYLRRVLRIYPAVWLQLAVLVVLGLVLPQVFVTIPWQSLLLNALLWVNLPPYFAPPLNAVWWTMPVELLFYLCLPVLVGVKRRAGFMVVAILALAITFGWRYAVMSRHAGQDLSSHIAVLDALPGVFAVFWAGCASAWVQHRLHPRHSKRLIGWSILAFLLMQVLLVSQIETYWKGGWLLGIWSSLLAVSLAGLVLAVCADTQGRMRRALSARPMVWLGEVSFGIYLWHLPVMHGLRELIPPLTRSIAGSLTALGAALGVTLLLAALSFYCVERPLMRWAKP